ncbi:MAG: circadian clock protein KaiC [Phycisphaerae bacterium]
MDKIPTRIRNLDKILAGGLPAGRSTVIIGKPGTGKTMLAMEFLARNAAHGLPGLFLSFEEHPGRLRDNFASFDWGLADSQQKGDLVLYHSDLPHVAIANGQINIDGLLAILQSHLDKGIKLLAIDSIDVLLGLFEPEQDSKVLLRLQEWLRENGVTAVFTAKGDEQNLQQYGYLSYVADCVIHLDQRMAEQVRTRRLQVIKYRGSNFLSNEHPFVFTQKGMAFLPVNSVVYTGSSSQQRISTGVAGLDKSLDGGLHKGSTTLIAGPTGSGKTSLAAQFAVSAAARGQKTLMISYEESYDDLQNRMEGIGIDIQRCRQQGTLDVMNLVPEAKGVDEHLIDAVDRIESLRAEHLILDPVSALVRMGSGAAAFDFMIRLLGFCRSGGVTTLLTQDVAGDRIKPSLSGRGVSPLVDSIIRLRYREVDLRLHRELVVVKSRGSSHSHAYHGLGVGSQGLSVWPIDGPDSRDSEASRS